VSTTTRKLRSGRCVISTRNSVYVCTISSLLGIKYYTIINLARVWYDGLSPRERLCHPSSGFVPYYCHIVKTTKYLSGKCIPYVRLVSMPVKNFSWYCILVRVIYYVSPSNEGRHIVLVWFFLPLPLSLLLLLLSKACPDHNFFVFPDRSSIFGMWVHDHKAACRVPQWPLLNLDLWPQGQIIVF
jgi:hypothetical protein